MPSIFDMVLSSIYDQMELDHVPLRCHKIINFKKLAMDNVAWTRLLKCEVHND